MLETELKQRAVDVVTAETLASLNHAAARQWAFYAEVAQSPELRRLLSASAAFEEAAARKLAGILPRLTD